LSHATSAAVSYFIPRRAHSASSRRVRFLPLRAVAHPSPCQGVVDAVVPHQEVMAAVDVGAAAMLDLSSRHHEIRSGQTRSGLLQLHLALSSFLGCCKHMFQVFQVFHMHIESVFMWMFPK
jgi:hypothetical protein